MIELKRTTSQNTHFQELIKLLDKDLRLRNGHEHDQFALFNIIKETDSVVIAYKNQTPVGCGCFKLSDENTAELKRMYVKPEYRKQGIAGIILKELEDWVKERQVHKLILETGKRLPEAIRLYKKYGYTKTKKWGPYIGIKNSICMSKILKP